jgi:hypothetical protein
MVLCDTRDVGWHTYCVGLPNVPAGNGYCPNCLENGAVEPAPSNPRRTHRPVRTQSERPHARRENLGWAQVWLSVHASTGLDFDFPNLDFPCSLSSTMPGIARLLQGVLHLFTPRLVEGPRYSLVYGFSPQPWS